MTPLETIIRRRISQSGPMPVAEYMELCLSHPEHGYYHTRDPLGRDGDFTTAPEISQMFGELVGLWLAQAWIDQGRPAPFVLAELGPGRGTLMADALRATRQIPGFRQAAQVWLVETSPALRAKQAEALPGASPAWADSIAALPDLPLFVVANEFFDALPIRQHVRDTIGWRERMIGLARGKLAWGQSPPLPMPELDRDFPGLPDGVVAETQSAGQLVAAGIGENISARGGVALIVDYGAWHGTGDSLQALRKHQPVEPLQWPGQADLTAHVNFSALASASGLRAWPLQTQGAFLRQMGIAKRAEALQVRAAVPSQVDAALHRLTHADEMGTLFKVLCLTRDGAVQPPGFNQ